MIMKEHDMYEELLTKLDDRQSKFVATGCKPIKGGSSDKPSC